MRSLGVALLTLFLMACSSLPPFPKSSKNTKPLWSQAELKRLKTPCLSGLPSRLPIGEGIITGCDSAVWQVTQQYTSALSESCVVVQSALGEQHWCFHQEWRRLPRVLAHE